METETTEAFFNDQKDKIWKTTEKPSDLDDIQCWWTHRGKLFMVGGREHL